MNDAQGVTFAGVRNVGGDTGAASGRVGDRDTVSGRRPGCSCAPVFSGLSFLWSGSRTKLQ